jgi:acid stress chaperone HdeB
MLIFGQK